MNYSKSHIEFIQCNNDECIKCESDGVNQYCMGVPLKDLDSNHFDNDRFKNFNIRRKPKYIHSSRKYA